MSDSGSSVTLIFYKVGDDWYRGGEPFLNLVAAAAQGSSFTHVEIAIGEDEGQGGRMKNVLRVFNDQIGVVKLKPESNSFVISFFLAMCCLFCFADHRKLRNAQGSILATAICS